MENLAALCNKAISQTCMSCVEGCSGYPPAFISVSGHSRACTPGGCHNCTAHSLVQEGGKGGKLPDEAITPKGEDYSKWYLDLVAKAQLADYGPVRGAHWTSLIGFLTPKGMVPS